MAGEVKELVAWDKILYGITGAFAAFGVKVYQHIIKNDREGFRMPSEFPNKTETQGEIKLFGCSPAKFLYALLSPFPIFNINFRRV